MMTMHVVDGTNSLDEGRNNKRAYQFTILRSYIVPIAAPSMENPSRAPQVRDTSLCLCTLSSQILRFLPLARPPWPSLSPCTSPIMSKLKSVASPFPSLPPPPHSGSHKKFRSDWRGNINTLGTLSEIAGLNLAGVGGGLQILCGLASEQFDSACLACINVNVHVLVCERAETATSTSSLLFTPFMLPHVRSYTLFSNTKHNSLYICKCVFLTISTLMHLS